MIKEIKEVKEIKLHREEALYDVFAKCSKGETSDKSGISMAIDDPDRLEKSLLAIDKTAVGLSEYDPGQLKEIKRGHWDIYRRDCSNNKNARDIVTFKLPSDRTYMARSPLNDVKVGTVAIDFGTKSTVAGFIDEMSEKQLIRIGRGNIREKDTMSHYENPTIIEFCDITSFMVAYHSSIARPYTKWDDIKVSNDAEETFTQKSSGDDFYRFFYSLKQWAGNNEPDRVKDKSTTIKSFDLKAFLECGESDLNPIEIYAYYIGRYINNMHNGIYLDYLLSYPVKYSKAVKEKIRESFERGIRKSIPFEVLNDEECAKKFKVELRATEPAAYAISALKEYGFYHPDFADKLTHYGVFDFGGGTTDFDFGTWKGSETRNYDFDIRQFGANGDYYLGGENLLELIAFRIFKNNQETMRKNRCAFKKPVNEPNFGGSEGLIADTQEARKNIAELVGLLRPYWEGANSLNSDENDDGIDFKPTLTDIEGVKKSDIIIKSSKSEIKKILTDRIKSGVDSFYQSFKRVANKMNGLEELHVFLAGNSSRSVLVKEAFNEMIEAHKEDCKITLYEPLGTPESDEQKKRLGVYEETNDDLSKKVTCKTGVVFGLLDSRKTSKINVVPEVRADDEGNFIFFLGENRMDYFMMRIDPNNINIESDDPHFFANCVSEVLEFELFYTTNPRAVSNRMRINEVKRLHCALDKDYGNEAEIRIKATGVDTIRYCIYDKSGKKVYESEDKKLTK